MSEATARLGAKQNRYIASVLTHRTLAEAAEAAGISERAGRAYMQDPDVRQALSEAQGVILSEAARQAVAAMSAALQVLQDLANDRKVAPPTRVSAAKALLDAGRSLHSDHAAEDRLALLEDRLELLFHS